MKNNHGSGSAAHAMTWHGCAEFVTSALLVIGLLAIPVIVAPTAVQAGEIAIGISVGIAPPPLPVYVQPPIPGPGYIWTPGYWAYDPDDGYYWVPGTWVLAPEIGLLWTPGYWGWEGAAFFWHPGYWGHHIGFYGGVDYGYGYPGEGFYGGEWRGGSFFYNRSVNNFGREHFSNVYYRPVHSDFGSRRVSYNGGAGGLNVRPGRNDFVAQHERHFDATPVQRQHQTMAHGDRSQFANVNHGAPQVAATRRPGSFSGSDAVRATRAGGEVRPSGNRAMGGGNRPGGEINPNNNRSTERGGSAGPARANRTGGEINPNNNRPMERGGSAGPTHANRGAGEANPTYDRPYDRPMERGGSAGPTHANRGAGEANPNANRPMERGAPRQTMTPHSNPPAPHSNEARQERSAPPQMHSTPPPRNEGGRGQSASHEPPRQPQQHNSKPPESGHGGHGTGESR